MSLLNLEDVLSLKLECIPKKQLQKLATSLKLTDKGSTAIIIKKILENKPEDEIINKFIKEEYFKKIQKRRAIISDDDLKNELLKVNTFSWGVVQGQLDRKIQQEYVRKIVNHKHLVDSVKSDLHTDVTNYVICTWYNHWTTVLIEEHVSNHTKVIPTIKNKKGIDLFFDNQPFDLKVTYLPRDYDAIKAVRDPSKLAVWMYEHQGEERFGSDNRLFVVLLDQKNPEMSWELKRNFDLVFTNIDYFFDRQTVSSEDEIKFTFKNKIYDTISKVLLITN